MTVRPFFMEYNESIFQSVFITKHLTHRRVGSRSEAKIRIIWLAPALPKLMCYLKECTRVNVIEVQFLRGFPLTRNGALHLVINRLLSYHLAFYIRLHQGNSRAACSKPTGPERWITPQALVYAKILLAAIHSDDVEAKIVAVHPIVLNETLDSDANFLCSSRMQ
jgi:hypothetical protein